MKISASVGNFASDRTRASVLLSKLLKLLGLGHQIGGQTLKSV